MSAARWVSVIVAALLGTPSVARADDEPPPRADDEAPLAAAPPVFVPRFELQVAGGPVARRLFTRPLLLGAGELGIGAQVTPHLAVRGTIAYEEGATPHGLKARVLGATPSLEAVFDRFRVGGGAPIGAFALWRATDGSLISPHLMLGLRALASFDVIETERVAVYVGAHGECDWLFPALLFGGSAILGARFTLTPEQPRTGRSPSRPW